jgi:hypothetical protein
VSVVSHILSPVHCAIPVPCVVSPHLSLSRVRGPCSSFPVLMSLVPPSFPLFSPCRLSCPCTWYALSPSCPCPCPCPGPGPCTPPSTLRAVAHSRGGGCWVVVLAVVLMPAVPAMPAFPMPLAPSSHHPHPWCSPFPPHKQLLMAAVRGAAVLADVGVIRL